MMVCLTAPAPKVRGQDNRDAQESRRPYLVLRMFPLFCLVVPTLM
jgi:hypothetical protein